jgi:hypothetical protein
MTVPVPKVDERTAREISAEVRALLVSMHWPEYDDHGEFDSALIEVFARFAELIIHRLNQAPEKNLLAFLDLLGVSQLPMQAARVPLTFSMAPGSSGCALVTKGTQVAAPPGKGEQKPVTFETERELVVTPARLDSLLIKFGARDQYKDIGSTLLLPSDAQTVVSSDAIALTPAGALPIPHVLYISVPLNASWPKVDQLRVRFVLDDSVVAAADSRLVQWEMPTEDDPPRAVAGAPKVASSAAPDDQTSAKVVLIPQEDGTKNLTQNGDAVFLDLPRVAPVAIDGVVGSWLACRLLTPITRNTESVAEMVRASQLPTVKQVTCEMQLTRQGLVVEQAFYNGQKLDLTKDFFPFGERPKFGDVLYLGNREVFSDPDAQITIHVELTNPAEAGTDVGIPNTAIHNTQLSWEFWNGQAWTKLGRSGRFLRVGDGDAIETEFTDGTNSLSTDGDVSFKFPSPPRELILNGQKNYWIRVRIAAGNYGDELRFQRDASATGLVAQPATLAPPSIKSIKLDYVVKKEAQPPSILTCNDFAYTQMSAQRSFKPFTPVAVEDGPPSTYFGFTVDGPLGVKQPENSTTLASTNSQRRSGRFPNQTVTMYVAAGDVAAQKSGDQAANGEVAAWEYWNDAGWKKLSVRDETQSCRRSGLIQFIPPLDFATRKEFGREKYWLRMRSKAGGFDATIRKVILNTTFAMQGISVVNDILGSSNGKPSQKIQTIQATVLPGQKLEVREPTMPPLHERELVQADEGEDAIQTVPDPKGHADQYWVTWHEVPNFYGSGPRHRHYVLDHVKGEVTFGDGACGLIPPVLPGNIRMTNYHSGGGIAGNQPAQAVTKLASAVPYIQKVVNWMPSSGGTDAEANSMLLERGSRGVRHGGRAVTLEDFEDLAMLASRDVARAKCVPLYDLSAGPDAGRMRPGLISLIVLPSSSDPMPMPSLDLLERVRTYLDAWRLPTIEMVVVGPEYVRVDVEAEIVVEDPSDASDVELAVKQELDRYLHPVHGGPDGCGWEFGRLPRKFDLSVLIERIPRVNHVRELRVRTAAGNPGVEKTGKFLICCGQHKIAMVLEEQGAIEFA